MAETVEIPRIIQGSKVVDAQVKEVLWYFSLYKFTLV